jgi:starch phosphorylase
MRQEMTVVRKLTGSTGAYAYSAQVPATRPAADYTARIIPQFAGAAVPLEAQHIIWQK